MHFRKLYPSEWLGAWDLPAGRDVVVTIKSVKIETITGSDGKKEQKPVVEFEGKQKRMVMCKTNARQIAKQHGKETDEWTGKKVSIYSTTCMAFGAEVECIRVR